MKAIVVDKLSEDIHNIKYKSDIQQPEIEGEDEVLVKVKACGLNFYDILMIKGTYQIKQQLPFVLGTEFSGIVIKSNSKKFKVGEKVFGSALGANAEYVSVHENYLVHLPNNLSFIEGAGLFMTYPTALSALKLRADLKPGETVLIHGSTGGVGIVAVKIAKLMGANVIATGTDDGKLKIVKNYGADHVINLKKEGKNWINKVKELTKDNLGVEVVYDPVGLVNESSSCLKFSGKIIVIGFAKGKHEAIQTNRILVKNISIVGLHWGAYAQHQPKEIPAIWEQLLNWLSTKKLKPLIYPTTYDISETSKALALLKDRKAYAKVIVTVGDQNEGLNSKL